jgi:hypothetical protein
MEKPTDIFLLIGQFNMAGRGLLGEVADLSEPQVLMFRDDIWQRAKEPLHTDKASAGVGIGSGFALELLTQAADLHIGLVPCAVCGGRHAAESADAGYGSLRSGGVNCQASAC